MKYLLLLLLTLVCLTSCRQKQRRPYTSVLETKKSLVNQWYGPDHFKENDELGNPDKPLNRNEDQDSFESDAGQIIINPNPVATDNSTSQTNGTPSSASSTTPSTSSQTASPAPSTSTATSDLGDTKVEELVEEIDQSKQLSAETVEATAENEVSFDYE